MAPAPPPRLYIFDVDGTLRWTTVAGQRYPLARHEWRLMPNVAERLRAIPWSAAGPWLGIASNQTGVAEGLISRRLASELIADAIVAAIGHLPQRCAIEMCCCAPDAACPRHKPAPGMLLALATRFGVAPGEALFVGDLAIDEQAAARAGMRFAWAHHFFATV